MINRIRDVSAKVRDILERSNQSDHDNSSFSLKKFPSGCCGDTSIVLQIVLFKALEINAAHVSGTHYCEHSPINGGSHAWLEFNNHVIDITADQFNDRGFVNDSVMVTPDKTFHELFNEDKLSRPYEPSKEIAQGLQKTIKFVLSELNK